MSVTAGGIAYDREGARDRTPVLLLHAGVADRRMWDPQWSALVSDLDLLRLDLRGFGESDRRPEHGLSHVDDVAGTLDELDVERCHVVGASLGAGVATELAVVRPDLVASLLLAAPGGALIDDATPDLMRFVEAERAALAAHDLDWATEVNVTTWVDGPRRQPGDVDGDTRALVARMQRRAFEITADWDDVEEVELDPPVLSRLGDIRVATLVLSGALDIDAAQLAARSVVDGLGEVRAVEWPDVGHLPSLERPDEFCALLSAWLA